MKRHSEKAQRKGTAKKHSRKVQQQKAKQKGTAEKHSKRHSRKAQLKGTGDCR